MFGGTRDGEVKAGGKGPINEMRWKEFGDLVTVRVLAISICVEFWMDGVQHHRILSGMLFWKKQNHKGND